jgi:hypothetical protein
MPNDNEQQGGGSGFLTGAGGAMLGMIGGAIGAGSQHRRQRELMHLQHSNQMALNRQGHNLQYDLWKRTSYPAQLKMMKEAGLNPSLMYGGGPGSGGSTGSQTGGSAVGGSATAFQPMDLSNMMMMDAQKKLLEKQAEKVGAEKDDITGETPEAKARIAKLIAEKLNIDQNTVKAVQEVTNLKTLDEWNELKMKLDKQVYDRQEKGFIKGDAIGNIFEVIGLNPVQNKEDMELVRGMLLAWYGTKLGSDILQMLLPWTKFSPKKGGGFGTKQMKY